MSNAFFKNKNVLCVQSLVWHFVHHPVVREKNNILVDEVERNCVVLTALFPFSVVCHMYWSVFVCALDVNRKSHIAIGPTHSLSLSESFMTLTIFTYVSFSRSNSSRFSIISTVLLIVLITIMCLSIIFHFPCWKWRRKSFLLQIANNSCLNILRLTVAASWVKRNCVHFNSLFPLSLPPYFARFSFLDYT